MEETITFHISAEDKKMLEQEALTNKLSTSSYCRYILLKLISNKKNVEAKQ